MVGGLQNKKIAFIIQARMGSTRLPGKILMPLPLETNKCLLDHIVNNLKKSNFSNLIYIATSLNSDNNAIEDFCDKNNIECYRGSEEDVLSRYIDITMNHKFDHVVRLTGDNPFLDVNLLDKSIDHHITSGADYTSTSGLPLGMNFEIISAKTLQGLSEKILSKPEREHVTLHIKSSIGYHINTYIPIDEDLSFLRLTIDYASDYLVASTILSIAEKLDISPNLELIKYCLKKYPWIFEVNKDNVQKINYNNIREEIEIARPILDKYGFDKLITFIDDNEFI